MYSHNTDSRTQPSLLQRHFNHSIILGVISDSAGCFYWTTWYVSKRYCVVSMTQEGRAHARSLIKIFVEAAYKHSCVSFKDGTLQACVHTYAYTCNYMYLQMCTLFAGVLARCLESLEKSDSSSPESVRTTLALREVCNHNHSIRHIITDSHNTTWHVYMYIFTDLECKQPLSRCFSAYVLYYRTVIGMPLYANYLFATKCAAD